MAGCLSMSSGGNDTSAWLPEIQALAHIISLVQQREETISSLPAAESLRIGTNVRQRVPGAVPRAERGALQAAELSAPWPLFEVDL